MPEEFSTHTNHHATSLKSMDVMLAGVRAQGPPGLEVAAARLHAAIVGKVMLLPCHNPRLCHSVKSLTRVHHCQNKPVTVGLVVKA